jgi:transposase
MEKQTAVYRSSGRGPAKYPDDIRKSAIDMFNRSRTDFNTRTECARHVADLLGIGSHKTLLGWVRQAEVDGGLKEGLTTDDRQEIKRLRREVAELRRANGILKAASAFFAAELDRPQTKL